MCDQRDAMREVRAAAECLSAVCTARENPTIQSLTRFYDETLAEPVPEALQVTLDRLGDDTTQH